ncbi:MAG: type II toxin-antitoxin system VapC family toxin [Opitutaceae bacterium]
MTTYADSSFLVSRYVKDAFTERAKAWLAGHSHNLPLTEFGRVELRNAFARLTFAGSLTATQASAAWQMIEADIKQRRLAPITVEWSLAFGRAEELTAKHTGQLGTRTLDVLHVAIALSLRCTEFVTFDQRQGTLAKASGLNWQLPA